MKISPLEIRKKEFQKKFRGYDTEEVKAFLISLSYEWNKIIGENNELIKKLDSTEQELKNFIEIQSSMAQTLKLAEVNKSNIEKDAHKKAQLQFQSAQNKIEKMQNEALEKAKNILENAEKEATIYYTDAKEKVEKLQNEYEKIDAKRNNALNQLTHIAREIINKIEEVNNEKKPTDLTKELNELKKIHNNSKFILTKTDDKDEKEEDSRQKISQQDFSISLDNSINEKSPKKEDSETSFFDSII